MAALALRFYFFVGAADGEIGLVVTKQRAIHGNDLRRPPLVFGVTGSAGGVAQLAVKPIATLDISGNLFMAIEAQSALSRFVKHLVAIVTLLFQFCMGCGYFSRHNQIAYRLGLRQQGCKAHEQRREKPDGQAIRHQYMCTATTW
jgi:hypothetical protein